MLLGEHEQIGKETEWKERIFGAGNGVGGKQVKIWFRLSASLMQWKRWGGQSATPPLPPPILIPSISYRHSSCFSFLSLSFFSLGVICSSISFPLQPCAVLTYRFIGYVIFLPRFNQTPWRRGWLLLRLISPLIRLDEGVLAARSAHPPSLFHCSEKGFALQNYSNVPLQCVAWICLTHDSQCLRVSTEMFYSRFKAVMVHRDLNKIQHQLMYFNNFV